MAERGNGRSRNPNLCASCSSLADGRGPADREEGAETAPDPGLMREDTAPAIQSGWLVSVQQETDSLRNRFAF